MVAVHGPRCKEEVSKYEIEVRHYEANLVRTASLKKLSLQVIFGLDRKHINLEPIAHSCGKNLKNCTTLPVLQHPEHEVNVEMNLATSSNLSLTLMVLPRDSSAPKNLNTTYVVTVSVSELADKLREVALEISTLQARIDSIESFDGKRSLAETRAKLVKVTKERNDLLWKAYHEQEKDLSYDSTEMGTPTFLAVGLTGTGKSELCRWMTGNLKKCVPSRSTESNTSEVTRVSEPAFSDKNLPVMEWIDTPGRGDTRGGGMDAELWNQTMENLMAKGDGHIDTIVWVINAAWQRGTAARELMLTELRKSFGIHLYKHLTLLLNFLPHTANSSLYEADLAFQKEKFVNWIMKREDEMYKWTAWLRRGVEDEVKNLAVSGVNLNPESYSQVPQGLPLSAPYLSKFPPFSYPSGIGSLISLFNATLSQRKLNETKELRVDNPHPQIGPGTLDSFHSLRLICGFKVMDHQKMRHVATLHVEVEGKQLSQDDGAILLPKAADCGDPSAKHWPSDWQQSIQKPQNVSVSNSSAHFSFLLNGLSSPRDSMGDDGFGKFCFRESPWSNESQRFGQSLGLSGDLPECPSPFTTIDVSDYARNLRLARVGNQLLGVPSWSKPTKLNVFPLLDLETQKLSEFPNKASAGPVMSDEITVLDSKVYGVAKDHLVVVDPCLRN